MFLRESTIGNPALLDNGGRPPDILLPGHPHIGFVGIGMRDVLIESNEETLRRNRETVQMLVGTGMAETDEKFSAHMELIDVGIDHIVLRCTHPITHRKVDATFYVPAEAISSSSLSNATISEESPANIDRLEQIAANVSHGGNVLYNTMSNFTAMIHAGVFSGSGEIVSNEGVQMPNYMTGFRHRTLEKIKPRHAIQILYSRIDGGTPVNFSMANPYPNTRSELKLIAMNMACKCDRVVSDRDLADILSSEGSHLRQTLNPTSKHRTRHTERLRKSKLATAKGTSWTGNDNEFRQCFEFEHSPGVFGELVMNGEIQETVLRDTLGACMQYREEMHVEPDTEGRIECSLNVTAGANGGYTLVTIPESTDFQHLASSHWLIYSGLPSSAEQSMIQGIRGGAQAPSAQNSKGCGDMLAAVLVALQSLNLEQLVIQTGRLEAMHLVENRILHFLGLAANWSQFAGEHMFQTADSNLRNVDPKEIRSVVQKAVDITRAMRWEKHQPQSLELQKHDIYSVGLMENSRPIVAVRIDTEAAETYRAPSGIREQSHNAFSEKRNHISSKPHFQQEYSREVAAPQI